MRAQRDRDAAAARGPAGRCSARRVETVLAERPCRVIIQSDGAERRRRRRTSRAAEMAGLSVADRPLRATCIARRDPRSCSVAMLVIGVALIVRAVTAGGGAAGRRASSSACCSSLAGAGRLWVAGPGG